MRILFLPAAVVWTVIFICGERFARGVQRLYGAPLVGKWNATKVQATASLLSLGVTAILVWVTWQYVDLTDRLVRLGIEPSVFVEFHTGIPNVEHTVEVWNDGSPPIVEVAVNYDTMLALGGHRLGKRGTALAPSRESNWWFIPRLEPGEAKRQPVGALLGILRDFRDMNQSAWKRANPPGPIPKLEEYRGVIFFQVSFRREIDRKGAPAVLRGLIVRYSTTGEPILMDEDAYRWFSPPVPGEEAFRQLLTASRRLLTPVRSGRTGNGREEK